MPSLKDLAQQPHPNSAVNTAVEEEVPVSYQVRNEAFGLQDLKKYWEDFADKKRLEGKNREYILLKEDISLLENHTVEIKLSSSLMEETLNVLKTEILVFLREKLSNDSITITSVLQSEDRKRRLYTTREKFDHLVEKHPLLLELKEKLGLDPDF